MPARIRNSTQRLSAGLSSRITSSSQSPPSFLSCCTCPSSCSSSSSSSNAPPSTRSFSSTPSRQLTKLRRDMFDWLNGPGSAFKHPLPGSTNYLSAYDRRGNLLRAEDKPKSGESGEGQKEGEDGKEASDGDGDPATPQETTDDLKPFPLNPHFVSENVLSEELRNEIYDQVAVKGKSMNAVSVNYGVDLRRVGAVVRLVELEKRMVEAKKPLARPYARAVEQMLPTTKLAKQGEKQAPHESINDLPVHHLTRAQIFYPVSESRQFNRVDAGRVFSAAPALLAEDRDKPGNTPESINRVTHNPAANIEFIGKRGSEEEVLQPAEVRIAHPHLVASEHEKLRLGEEEGEKREAFERHVAAADSARRARKQRQKERVEQSMTRVEPEGSRYEFRFRDVVVSRQTTGSTGRDTKAPGRRYGVPSSDGKRGKVKIPTRVIV